MSGTSCCICSRLVDDSLCPLCAEHATLADVAGLVLAGALSDWRLARTAHASSSPTHNAMMTLPTRGHGGNWRVDIATILAANGVILDDGAEFGE